MATAIADAMIGALELTGNEDVLDYGTGTGNIALRMQPLVRQVIAADSSRGMLEVLEGKLAASNIGNVRSQLLDLEREVDSGTNLAVDVIVSAMTLHHVADTARFARTLHAVLPRGGKLAIADLDKEDGDFHSDNTGVEHFGFDRNELGQVFAAAGFEGINFETAYDFVRPTAQGQRNFPIFLLTARKP